MQYDDIYTGGGDDDDGTDVHFEDDFDSDELGEFLVDEPHEDDHDRDHDNNVTNHDFSSDRTGSNDVNVMNVTPVVEREPEDGGRAALEETMLVAEEENGKLESTNLIDGQSETKNSNVSMSYANSLANQATEQLWRVSNAVSDLQSTESKQSHTITQQRNQHQRPSSAPSKKRTFSSSPLTEPRVSLNRRSADPSKHKIRTRSVSPSTSKRGIPNRTGSAQNELKAKNPNPSIRRNPLLVPVNGAKRTAKRSKSALGSEKAVSSKPLYKVMAERADNYENRKRERRNAHKYDSEEVKKFIEEQKERVITKKLDEELKKEEERMKKKEMLLNLDRQIRELQQQERAARQQERRERIGEMKSYIRDKKEEKRVRRRAKEKKRESTSSSCKIKNKSRKRKKEKNGNDDNVKNEHSHERSEGKLAIKKRKNRTETGHHGVSYTTDGSPRSSPDTNSRFLTEGHPLIPVHSIQKENRASHDPPIPKIEDAKPSLEEQQQVLNARRIQALRDATKRLQERIAQLTESISEGGSSSLHDASVQVSISGDDIIPSVSLDPVNTSRKQRDIIHAGTIGERSISRPKIESHPQDEMHKPKNEVVLLHGQEQIRQSDMLIARQSIEGLPLNTRHAGDEYGIMHHAHGAWKPREHQLSRSPNRQFDEDGGNANANTNVMEEEDDDEDNDNNDTSEIIEYVPFGLKEQHLKHDTGMEPTTKWSKEERNPLLIQRPSAGVYVTTLSVRDSISSDNSSPRFPLRPEVTLSPRSSRDAESIHEGMSSSDPTLFEMKQRTLRRLRMSSEVVPVKSDTLDSSRFEEIRNYNYSSKHEAQQMYKKEAKHIDSFAPLQESDSLNVINILARKKKFQDKLRAFAEKHKQQEKQQTNGDNVSQTTENGLSDSESTSHRRETNVKKVNDSALPKYAVNETIADEQETSLMRKSSHNAVTDEYQEKTAVSDDESETESDAAAVEEHERQSLQVPYSLKQVSKNDEGRNSTEGSIDPNNGEDWSEVPPEIAETDAEVLPSLDTMIAEKYGPKPLQQIYPERLSPDALARRMHATIDMLDQTQESRLHLADIEKAREISAAQQETIALVQYLHRTHQEEDIPACEADSEPPEHFMKPTEEEKEETMSEGDKNVLDMNPENVEEETEGDDKSLGILPSADDMEPSDSDISLDNRRANILKLREELKQLEKEKRLRMIKLRQKQEERRLLEAIRVTRQEINDLSFEAKKIEEGTHNLLNLSDISQDIPVSEESAPPQQNLKQEDYNPNGFDAYLIGSDNSVLNLQNVVQHNPLLANPPKSRPSVIQQTANVDHYLYQSETLYEVSPLVGDRKSDSNIQIESMEKEDTNDTESNDFSEPTDDVVSQHRENNVDDELEPEPSVIESGYENLSLPSEHIIHDIDAISTYEGEDESVHQDEQVIQEISEKLSASHELSPTAIEMQAHTMQEEFPDEFQSISEHASFFEEKEEESIPELDDTAFFDSGITNDDIDTVSEGSLKSEIVETKSETGMTLPSSDHNANDDAHAGVTENKIFEEPKRMDSIEFLHQSLSERQVPNKSETDEKQMPEEENISMDEVISELDESGFLMDDGSDFEQLLVFAEPKDVDQPTDTDEQFEIHASTAFFAKKSTMDEGGRQAEFDALREENDNERTSAIGINEEPEKSMPSDTESIGEYIEGSILTDMSSNDNDNVSSQDNGSRQFEEGTSKIASQEVGPYDAEFSEQSTASDEHLSRSVSSHNYNEDMILEHNAHELTDQIFDNLVDSTLTWATTKIQMQTKIENNAWEINSEGSEEMNRRSYEKEPTESEPSEFFASFDDKEEMTTEFEHVETGIDHGCTELPEFSPDIPPETKDKDPSLPDSRPVTPLEGQMDQPSSPGISPPKSPSSPSKVFHQQLANVERFPVSTIAMPIPETSSISHSSPVELSLTSHSVSSPLEQSSETNISTDVSVLNSVEYAVAYATEILQKSGLWKVPIECQKNDYDELPLLELELFITVEMDRAQEQSLPVDAATEDRQIFDKLVFDCVNEYIEEANSIRRDAFTNSRLKGHIFGQDAAMRTIIVSKRKRHTGNITLDEFVHEKLKHAFSQSQNPGFQDFALFEMNKDATTTALQRETRLAWKDCQTEKEDIKVHVSEAVWDTLLEDCVSELQRIDRQRLTAT